MADIVRELTDAIGADPEFAKLRSFIEDVTDAFADLDRETQNAMNSSVAAFKRAGGVISSMTAEERKALTKTIAHVREFAGSTENASRMLAKLGLSTKFIRDELRRLDKGLKDTSKSTSGLSKVMGILKGDIAGAAGSVGILYGSLKSLGEAAGKYSKEIYNATRVSNIFGQSAANARAGLKDMASSVGLNESQAAKFYQTWVKVSAGMAPTTKQMTRFIKSIGDEFGNTETDIQNVLGQVGKLESMQIGIDMTFVERLHDGLVSDTEMMEKMNKLTLLDPAGARESIEMLARFRDSANVGEETKQLKTMDDLMRHLDSTIEAFIAKNGEALKDVIKGMVTVAETIMNIISFLSKGGILQFVIATKAVLMVTNDIALGWKSVLKYMTDASVGGGKIGKIVDWLKDTKLFGKLSDFLDIKKLNVAMIALTTTIFLVNLGMNAWYEKLSGITGNINKFDEALKLQREGNIEGAKAKRLEAEQGAGSKGKAAMATYLGAGVGAIIGLGLAGIAATAFGVAFSPIIPIIAAFGGGIFALIKASKSLAKETTKVYTTRLAENAIIQQGRKLRSDEVELLQKKAASDVKRIKEASYGKEGWMASLKEQLGWGRGGMQKRLGLAEENVRYEKEIEDIQSEIDKTNDKLLDAYANKNTVVIKQLSQKKEQLEQQHYKKSLDRKKNELQMFDKKYSGGGEELDKAAKEALETEKGRSNQLIETYRRMGAVSKQYESQKKIAEELYQAHLSILDAMQLAGDLPGAEEALNKTREQMQNVTDASAEAAAQISKFVRSMAGMSSDQKKEQITEGIASLEKQITAAEQEGSGVGEDKIKKLKEEKSQLEEVLNGRKTLADVEALAQSDFAKQLRASYESQKNVLKPREMALEMARSEQDVGRANLEMVKSFMGGIGLTYEMQIEQLGRVQKTRQVLTQQLMDSQNQVADNEKSLAEASAELSRAKDTEDLKQIEVAEKRFKVANANLASSVIVVNKLKIEGVNITKEELELTKDLRFGYLSAMQSQALAAGQFSKILFTREQNMNEMLDMRSERMKKMAEEHPEEVGVSGYVEELGGRVRNERELYLARQVVRGGPAQFGTEGMNTGSFGYAQQMINERGRYAVPPTTMESIYPGYGAGVGGAVAPYGAVALQPMQQSVLAAQAANGMLAQEASGRAAAVALQPMQQSVLAAQAANGMLAQEASGRAAAVANAGIRIPPLGQAQNFGAGYSAQGEWLGIHGRPPGTAPVSGGVAVPSLAEQVYKGAKEGIIAGMQSWQGVPVKAGTRRTGGVAGSTSSSWTSPRYAISGALARKRAIDLVGELHGEKAKGQYIDKLITTQKEVAARKRQQEKERKNKTLDAYWEKRASEAALTKKRQAMEFARNYLALQPYMMRQRLIRENKALSQRRRASAEYLRQQIVARSQYYSSQKDVARRRKLGRNIEQRYEGMRVGFAANGAFPGSPKGTDTERYFLNDGDVVLNRNASKLFGQGELVTHSGGDIRGNGNLPYYLSPDERIIGAKDARKIGYDILRSYNSAGLMQKGGIADLGPFAGPTTQINQGNNVSVGGVNIGYNYDSNKSKNENDSNLIAATINQVEKELRNAMKQKHKSRLGA